MKKILSLLLVAVMALSMAACGSNEPTTEPTTKPTTTPTTEATTEPTTEATEPSTDGSEPTGEKEIYSVNFNLGAQYISIMNNENGTVSVDMNTDVRKKGDVDASILTDVMTALENSGILSLIGTEIYGETGENWDNLYITYSDWTGEGVTFSCSEPTDEYKAGFAAYAAEIATLLADMPVYVPQVNVDTFNGEIDADLLVELQNVANNSNHPGLEYLTIMNIPMDEYFTYTANLSTAEGITAGAICQNQMMGSAVYTLTAVKAADTAAVAADFEANMNWNGWVCVRPHNGLIATKGDMVLCFMSDASLYEDTKTALVNAGWTIGNELTDPGM